MQKNLTPTSFKTPKSTSELELVGLGPLAISLGIADVKIVGFVILILTSV